MLKIVTIPNDILRRRSKEMDRDLVLSPEIQALSHEMIPTMYEADGVGLAAPQIGKNIRLCVIAKHAFKNNIGKSKIVPFDMDDDLVLINPVWTKLSRKTNIDVEGCLSVPKTFGKMKRYIEIHVDSLDKSGKKISFDAYNLFARVIQHEVDHLDGILFIDKAKGIYNLD